MNRRASAVLLAWCLVLGSCVLTIESFVFAPGRGFNGAQKQLRRDTGPLRSPSFLWQISARSGGGSRRDPFSFSLGVAKRIDDNNQIDSAGKVGAVSDGNDKQQHEHSHVPIVPPKKEDQQKKQVVTAGGPLPSRPLGKANASVVLQRISALCLVAAIGMVAVPSLASSIPLAFSSVCNNVSCFVSRFSASGFYQAFSLTFLSEIGDKTFFMAGMLAAKTSRLLSFVGSVSALSVMSVIAVLIGQIFHAVPAGLTSGLPLDDYAAVLTFVFFGVKTLRDSYKLETSPPGVALSSSGVEEDRLAAKKAVDGSDDGSKRATSVWAQLLTTFSLIFAAEFADRSFLTTIALGAAQNPVSVALGSIFGHAIATSVAVIGGAYIAKYISEKILGYVGGGLFLLFAITTAIGLL